MGLRYNRGAPGEASYWDNVLTEVVGYALTLVYMFGQFVPVIDAQLMGVAFLRMVTIEIIWYNQLYID